VGSVSPDQNFERLTIRLAYGTTLKRGSRRRDKVGQVRAILRTLDIDAYVVETSAIGNSLIELYLPEDKAERVRTLLQHHRSVTIVHNYNPLAQSPLAPPLMNLERVAARRLSICYSWATMPRLQECMLRGLPLALQTDICLRAELIHSQRGQALHPRPEQVVEFLRERDEEDAARHEADVGPPDAAESRAVEVAADLAAPEQPAGTPADPMPAPADQEPQGAASPALHDGGATPQRPALPLPDLVPWLNEPDWDCLESSTAFEGASPQLGDDADAPNPNESQHAGACGQL
jgi:hypothetical protein